MALPPIKNDKPRPRILQHKQKRFSLRLEEGFWSQLNSIAMREKKRPGALVAELAEQYQGKNLSSYVRSFCLSDLQRQTISQTADENALSTMDAIKSSPAAALILNQDGLILDHNVALTKWLGDPAPALIHTPFTELFVPRMARSFSDTIELMLMKRLKRTQMQVLYTRPGGQNLSALATLINLTPQKQNGLTCLVWFSVSAPYRLRVQ